MNRDKLAIIEQSLFKDDKSELSATQMLIIQRYEAAYTMMLENPLKPKKKVVLFLTKKFSIENKQAYRDLQIVEQLLGNIKNAAKEWLLYRSLAMVDRTFELAENDSDIQGMNGAIRNHNDVIKMMDEAKDSLLDKVPNLPIEPSSDPSLLRGIKPIPNINQEIDKMLKKYQGEIEIEDAIIIEDLTEDEAPDA
jgi:hypothetical protein